jgi:Flp pilus assembly protein TadD
MSILRSILRAPEKRRLLARFALPIMVGLALTACAKRGGGDITGSINRAAQTMTVAEKRIAAEQLGQQYSRSPGEKHVTLSYARILRDLNQTNQAIAVLQASAVRYPNDREVAAALGKTLAEGGRFTEALEVLGRAHSPDRPDWTVLNTQGAINDQMGRHQDAQSFYLAALAIRPGEPDVMSNYGLSLALTNRLPEAERMLRDAVAHPASRPRARGNLAVVLALQGRYAEAEQMASKDMSPEDAAANVTYLRSMVGQRNAWRDLQKLDSKQTVAAQNRPKQR